MKLEIENKKIELVYRTRKIVNITKELEVKNFEELYFEAFNKNDIGALAKMVYTFAEDMDNGLQAFKNEDEASDFIDDYKKVKEKSYQDLFKEIAEDINEQGFFTKKMTAEELQSRISNLSSIDMNEIIEKSAGKAVETVATEIFKGYVG